jgi:sugar phosphate permease
VRYQVLAAGCILALLTYVARLGFVRAVPEIKSSLGLDDQMMGYVAAAFLVAYGGFQMPGGWLGDRFGARHVLTLQVLSWSLLTGAVALTVQLPHHIGLQMAFLLGSRFLFGMLQAGGFPTWARVIADWMPVSERGLAQGMVWTFSRLGGAVSPFAFLWLLQLFGTWTTPFWVLALLGVGWCACFWPWFRNRPEEMPTVNAAERQLIASGRPLSAVEHHTVRWERMLRSMSVWGLCLMYGFVGFSGNFITNMLPLYLEDHRHLSPVDTTWVFGVTLGCGVVSCVLGGFLSDWFIRRTGNRKWGRRLNGCLGLGFAGLATLSVPLAREVWLMALLVSAWFFCNDLIMGPAWASCADIGERYAGTLSGAMNMIGAFAGAAGMALAGSLLGHGQSDLMFMVFACSYGLAALSWLLVDVTKPLQGHC